jgi:hypothetical protein
VIKSKRIKWAGTEITRGNDRSIYILVGKQRSYLRDVGLDGRIILKLFLKNTV